jgi:hypothetical protein
MTDIKNWKKIYKILFIIGSLAVVGLITYLIFIFGIKMPTVFDK